MSIFSGITDEVRSALKKELKEVEDNIQAMEATLVARLMDIQKEVAGRGHKGPVDAYWAEVYDRDRLLDCAYRLCNNLVWSLKTRYGKEHDLEDLLINPKGGFKLRFDLPVGAHHQDARYDQHYLPDGEDEDPNDPTPNISLCDIADIAVVSKRCIFTGDEQLKVKRRESTLLLSFFDYCEKETKLARQAAGITSAYKLKRAPRAQPSRRSSARTNNTGRSYNESIQRRGRSRRRTKSLSPELSSESADESSPIPVRRGRTSTRRPAHRVVDDSDYGSEEEEESRPPPLARNTARKGPAGNAQQQDRSKKIGETQRVKKNALPVHRHILSTDSEGSEEEENRVTRHVKREVKQEPSFRAPVTEDSSDSDGDPFFSSDRDDTAKTPKSKPKQKKKRTNPQASSQSHFVPVLVSSDSDTTAAVDPRKRKRNLVAHRSRIVKSESSEDSQIHDKKKQKQKQVSPTPAASTSKTPKMKAAAGNDKNNRKEPDDDRRPPVNTLKDTRFSQITKSLADAYYG